MIQMIQRAGSILRALGAHPQGLSVGEVASKANLPRSTAHRILTALVEEHLVMAVSEQGGYRLGPALMRLASTSGRWITERVHPLLEKLSVELDETVDLAVRSGRSLFFVDQVAAPNRLQAVSGVGREFPLHCTANGKAMLAAVSDDEVRALLDGALEAHTPATITDLDRLLEELAQVRSTGVAFDREEHHAGISAIGTELVNTHGLPMALSVPVPTSRFVDRERELTKTLLAGRRAIERALTGG